MQELTLAVVGIDHPNADRSRSSRRFELLQCDPGELVELRAEPRNTHDRHAVAVWSVRGVQIGYLTAERAPWIGRRLAAEDTVAVFQRLDRSAAYIRVRFGGDPPTLPAANSPADAEPDFYPDPEGSLWGA